MPALKVSCLQMAVSKGDPEANLAKVRLLAARAASEGAGLLVLPEMWSGGFSWGEMPALAAATPGILARLGELARAHRVSLAGSLPEAHGEDIFNTLYLVGEDGEVRAAYRKIHLFPPMGEDSFLKPGSELVTAEVSGVTAGLAVCFDLRFPELSRKLALRGARLLLVSAQWPAERLDHWRTLLVARAVENQVFVAGANAAGGGPHAMAGHSLLADPTGRVLAEAGNEEEMVSAVLNTEAVDRARSEISYLARRVGDADEFLTLH